MSSIDRILGELLEFKRQTHDKLGSVDAKIDRALAEIHALKGFKIRVMAYASIASVLISLLAPVIFSLFKK